MKKILFLLTFFMIFSFNTFQTYAQEPTVEEPEVIVDHEVERSIQPFMAFPSLTFSNRKEIYSYLGLGTHRIVVDVFFKARWDDYIDNWRIESIDTPTYYVTGSWNYPITDIEINDVNLNYIKSTSEFAVTINFTKKIIKETGGSFNTCSDAWKVTPSNSKQY